MAILGIDLSSERAVKARVAKYLGGTLARLLVVAAVLLTAGGIVLVVAGYPVGWFVAGLAAIPAMLAQWYSGDLKALAVDPKGERIDAFLERSILAEVREDMGPKQIAELAGKSQSGQFMAVRFGITANFLLNIASDDVKAADDVWVSARNIQQALGSEVVHGGILAVALLEQYPQYELLLAQMHLEMNDLLDGIKWYDHIQMLVKKQRAPKRTGGIARDWSFGYTPLLKRFGQNLSEVGGAAFTTDIESRLHATEQLVDILGGAGKQSVAIVGAEGVGKSTVLHAFAQRLLDANAKIPSSLRFRQVFLLDSSALISAAPGRGELEGLVMRVLTEAYRAKNIIICLDNAQLFFEEGVGSVDLTNVLLPILEAGNLRIILTMDEQRLLQIGQRNPGLVNALNRILLPVATQDETLRIMRDHLIMTEYQHKVTYMHQSLAEAYRLSQRYIHDIEMPGRALKLLDTAARYAEGGTLVTANSVQQAIEQTMNVKVGTADAQAERETLLNLEEKIHERMINQTRAVQVVSDALRRARAGVRNQERPIGTFLFLGPTGVGKTELAKALADVYFGGEGNIIRLDFNEYVTINDVSRLIADGADDPNSLTAQVMKQPFSVILLDEVEKAHPAVLTTLLQLLDEGILRDVKNREVSFRDAIIIATSNAGAEKIQQYIAQGYSIEQFEQPFLDHIISSSQFKPEFINRFDEIVTFTPLGKEELVQVIDLMIAGVNKTLALQKVIVEVEDDAKLYLVDKGYDPRLGARPLRRVVQRAIENTVAKAMLGGDVTPGATIRITLDQVQSVYGAESAANAIVSEGGQA